MRQARKAVQAAGFEDELSGLPLPLIARYAGHWKARTQQHKEPVQPAKMQTALSPMEELLGRGSLMHIYPAGMGLASMHLFNESFGLLSQCNWAKGMVCNALTYSDTLVFCSYVINYSHMAKLCMSCRSTSCSHYG